ncbi:MAG: methylmalonyl Co-A mutase-associated GTPase MeaB [Anaerolineales bacterium]|nr:methylmalonyl Co-A mutase-associated GTPase MeaB [Anaerolineales bacterium]
MLDVPAVLGGDRRALARLLTQIENGTAAAEAALAELYPHTGQAHLIGVTGPPGSGKSSLVNQLALCLRRGRAAQGGLPARAPASVAVVAVDPSSPFTGGAILGDRIRMRDLAGDPSVFIRSMASRGSLGGLARATGDVVKALDAAGFDKILIETVGAGQSEVDIARAAHTTLVVEAPGLGDDVQAIKAGLLEIADILVVNKSDLPGAAAAVRALRASLDLAHPAARRWATDSTGHHGPALGSVVARPEPEAGAGPWWVPPIVATVAIESQGLETLLDAIDQHQAHLRATGELARRERERLAHELESRLRDQLLAELRDRLGPLALDAALNQVAAREKDPGSAARELAAQALRL